MGNGLVEHFARQTGFRQGGRTYNPRMPRLAIIAAAALASGAVLGGQTPAAEAPVPISAEPHHKRVLYTAHLRMFEIAVPPGASTLDHTHDRDVAVAALAPSTIRTRDTANDWSAPRSYAPGGINLVSYTGMPGAHRMENVGTTPYRVFAVENMREGGWTMPRVIAAPATKLLQEARSFAAYEVRLTQGTPRTSHVHEQPTVVILIAGGVVVQGGGGESEFRMETPGRWFASSWDQPHTLSLIGANEAHLVEIEAR